MTGPGGAAPPGDTSDDAPGRSTVVGLGLGDRLLLGIGAPVLGLVLGYLLPRLADWGLKVPWKPLKAPLKLIASFDGTWLYVVSLGAGLALGVGLAYAAVVESLKVTVTDAAIRLDKNEKTRTLPRDDVDSVFLDGKYLVVIDRESRQLVRDKHESTAAKVAQAFREHGYPWAEQDPYAELYRRWVPDTPDLPPAVNAVLAAREGVLRQKSGRDIAELREEVQKLGFVVRDEGTRQYWRPFVRS
jgi:hypothetical protein